MKRWRAVRGFTILEVLLAMVILSMISMTLWTTFSNSFRMRDKLDLIEEKTQAMRGLLMKFGRDVQLTYLVKDKRYHTLFTGKDDGAADTLTFSAMSSRVYQDDAKFSDQVIVSYYTATNRDEPTLLDVYRWSYPYIEDDQYWGEKRGTVVMERVRRFDLQYYDGSSYRPVWDTEQADFAGKLPEAVKLTLELENQQVVEDIFMLSLPTVLGGNPIKAPVAPVPSPTPGQQTPQQGQPPAGQQPPGAQPASPQQPPNSSLDPD